MSKNYKPSQYNITTYDFNNDLLITNLLRTKFLKVKDNKKNYVEALLNSKTMKYEDLADYVEMIEDGFFVEEDIKEFDICNLKYNELVYSNDALEITLIPTDDCNFKCIYCYQEDREYSYMSREVEDRILKFIDRNTPAYKKINIHWFGGEPLLIKDNIISFMEKANEICKKHKKPLTGYMSTNGYELDIETFKKFISNKLLFFQITIDGTEKTHNIHRPHKSENDSYQRIMKNLTDIKNNINGFYKINLRINITQSILSEMNEYIEALSVFKNDDRFQIHWQLVRDYGGEKVHNLTNEMVSFSDIFVNYIDKATVSGVKTMYEFYFDFGSGLCSAPKRNSFYINHNGDILKCSLAIYDDKHRDSNKIGTIDHNGVMNLDENKHAKWILRNDVDEKCKKCSYYPLCFGAICPLSRKFRGTHPCFPQKEELVYYMRSMSQNNKMKILA